MQNVLIRTGHGYESGDRGRCEAFDGFEIIAAPLHQEGDGWQAAFGDKARESRVYRRPDGRGGERGTDYGSHAIKLARQRHDSDLYILMHHGGGREVWRVPSFYDGGDLAAHIIGLPERLQYALLYTLYSMANNARTQAQAETRREWAQAFSDKRIRKKRKGGSVRVEIVPQWEIDLKAEAAKRAA
jgi:hypothetical protein